jgi:hypothetical protein
MIGFGYRKLAKEYGMTIKHGVAYGNMHGYPATLSEGMGFKIVAFTSVFESDEDGQAFADQLDEKMFEKCRVIHCDIGTGLILFVFEDNPGTMRRIREFLDHVFEILDGLHVLGIDHCHHCDKPIMGASSWKLVGNVACQFHPECVEAAIEEMKKEFAEDDEDDEDDDIDYGNHEIIIKDLD